ncbi:MAG: EpsG family protein [Clostridia bacterium]|nr:EpsG family protein [Clostridia bacterium]
MLKLMLLLFGVTFLAFMSETSHQDDAEYQLNKAGKKPSSGEAVASALTEAPRRMDFWCVLAALCMGFFSGLRTDYNDTWAYRNGFRHADTVAEYIESDSFKPTGNPLFYLFQSFVRERTDNYHIFFVIIGIFCFYSYVRFLKKNAPHFTASMYLFIAMGTCVFMLAAMKQSIAVAILTYAVDKLLEKKYVAFYALVVLAAGFHFYGVIFAVLPFFLTKPWTGKTYIILLGALLVMLTFESTLTTFIEASDDMGKHVATEEVFDNHSMSFIRVLVYSVVPIMTFVFRQQLFEDSTPAENLFVNMSIICFFVNSVGLVSAANLFSRLATYFEFGTIISLPIVVNKAFEKETAKTVMVIAMVCYFGYFLYEFIVSKNFSDSYRSISIFEFIQGVFA